MFGRTKNDIFWPIVRDGRTYFLGKYFLENIENLDKKVIKNDL